jgi:signal transduction histidine kinase
MFLVVQFVVSPAYSLMSKEVVNLPLTVYWAKIINGPCHLIEDVLKAQPVEQWKNTIDSLQSQFEFSVDIVPLNEIRWSEEENADLQNGNIVAKDGGKRFCYLINESEFVLDVGPMPAVYSISGYKNKLRVYMFVFYIIVSLIFSVFALLWTLPFTKNLKRINAAAISFGKGNFDKRVTISRHSSFSQLASGFNLMADRIQELISSHKELTHTISHELRTPLSRIRFNMEMFMSSAEPGELEKHRDAIRRNLDELDILISELLTYARFDRANFTPEKKAMAIGPWLEEIANAWNMAPRKLQIDIHSSLATVPTVQANPRLLERAVHNLYQNASRFAVNRIQVTLESDGSFVSINVDDDGPGIAEEDRDRIFNPFIRLSHEGENEFEGYGLGLAIVKRIAQWHGGSISVKDSSFGGALFSMKIPCASQ